MQSIKRHASNITESSIKMPRGILIQKTSGVMRHFCRRPAGPVGSSACGFADDIEFIDDQFEYMIKGGEKRLVNITPNRQMRTERR